MRHIGADDGSRSWFADECEECSDAGALERAAAAAAVLKMESGAEQSRMAAEQKDGMWVAP